MRRLDRYIGRSVLEPLLLSTAVIVGLYMVAEAFSNLDDYLSAAGSLSEALLRMGRVYLLRIPTFVAPVLPVATLVGASYGIAQLSGNNELTAMRALGVSVWRILAPVYVVAAVVALLGFADRELLVPKVEAAAAPDIQIWRGKADEEKQVPIFQEEEDTWFIFRYNLAKRSIRSVLIVNHKTGKTIKAQSAEILPGGRWKLIEAEEDSHNYPEREVKTALKHSDIELNLAELDVCSLKTLRRLIEREPENAYYRVLYHGRLAYPFAGIVLAALGLPFVIGSEKIRRSRVLGIGICILICLIFFTIQFFAAKLGHEEQLPPAVAAWLPTIMFGSLGFYLLETVHS